MIPRYSVAQARDRFAEIIHNLESQPRVELTHGGRTVAVLLSPKAFERLKAAQADFWENYQAFRAAYDLAGLDIGPHTFAETRDRSTHPVHPVRTTDL